MKTKPGRPSPIRVIIPLCILWMLITVIPAFAIGDYRTRIAVLPMKNATRETRYDSLCATVTETVVLGFKLMGKYIVVESDEDPGLLTLDTSSSPALAAYAKASRYDEMLMGTATKAQNGTLTFRLSLFSRMDGKIKYESSATAGSILEVFDAADEITVGLLSQVSDIHIGFGAVAVKTTSGKGSYTVFLNNERIRNPKNMLKKVLNGAYTFSVHQDRLLGDTEIFSKEIKVFEDQETVVSFAIPPATARETAFLQEQKEALLAAPSSQIGAFLATIAAFQQGTWGIDYDDALSEMQSRALAEAGAKAVDMLKTATAAGDERFYAKNPDFKGVREYYGNLARLVSNVFDHQLLAAADETPFNAPAVIQVAPDGAVIVLDSTEQVRISAAADGKKVNATMPVENVSPAKSVGQVAFDASSRAYYIHPDAPQVLELDGNLRKIRAIQIPGITGDQQMDLRIAVSEEGLIYLLGGSQVIVFEPGKQRETEIETAIQAGLAERKTAAVDCVFFDHDGRLNVLDATSQRILRFGVLGELLSVVQLAGIAADSQAAVDAMGYFYLTVPAEHRVVKYSPQGEIIASVGGYGTAPGEFSSPLGIAITGNGAILVADTYNNRVQVLVPMTTPVLIADVAAYGITLSRRESVAAKAQERMETTVSNIHAQDMVAPLAEGTGLLAAGAGLLIADAGTTNVIASTFASLGSDISFMGAAALLTSAWLAGARNRAAPAETVSQIQAIEMDAEYELDRGRYKSLAAAERIGFWTGVFPPLLGAAALFALEDAPASIAYLGPVVAGASVFIPPFLSNRYAGKRDGGLTGSAVVADALVLVAAAMYLTGASERNPEALDDSLALRFPALYPSLNGAWVSFQEKVSIYPMVAALGIRLAAGIYDMQTGWLEAKNTNLYKALKKKSPAPEVSLDMLPEKGLRVALTLRF